MDAAARPVAVLEGGDQVADDEVPVEQLAGSRVAGRVRNDAQLEEVNSLERPALELRAALKGVVERLELPLEVLRERGQADVALEDVAVSRSAKIERHGGLLRDG